MDNVTVILPAAGFGTRVSAAYDSGKELMLDPVTGQPLIDYHIEMVLLSGYNVVVVSRASKTTLNTYLSKRWATTRKFKVQLIPEPVAGEECYHTALASAPSWSKYNVLIFPDTRFSSDKQALKVFTKALVTEGLDLVLGLFDIEPAESPKYTIYNVSKRALQEKPPVGGMTSTEAVGVFVFNHKIGEALFNNLIERKPFQFDVNTGKLFKLSWYKDLTRNGKIEAY